MDKLGKYEIVDKIGVGGFGVVFKGYDPFIKRHVAIKTCSAEDRETRDRFLREAEIAGNLQHRNIVTVFEFGFQEETPYLVQEFLTGEDLDHKIKRRDEIPLADKVAWLIEVARGLEFAHHRGVVHRDIKPANIRIQHDNNAKILDFGIAKLAQQQSGLTQAGVTLGTASYLAPEQIRGERVDGRADVFAFGVLAYELLTYERPFRAQEISALFFKLLNERPAPVSSKLPGVPPELERIVMTCLEKEPEKRWSPTAELVRALERLERQGLATAIAAPAADEATMVHEAQTFAFAATQAARVPPAAAEPSPPPPQAATPAVAAAAGARAPGLHEIELETPRSGAIASQGMSTARFRGGHRAPYLLAAGLGAIAIVAILLMLGGRGDEPADPAAAAAPVEPAAAPAAQRQAPQPAGPAGTPQQPPVEPPAGGVPAEATPPGANPAPAAEARPEPPAPEPPKPEPPKRGRLIVGPAWDAGMTVTVEGRRYRLDREQTIELAAGSYALDFALETPAYAFEKGLRLRLGAGATERVSIPIEPPGRLTVQPHLNSRGGTVRIDGAIAGPAPLRGRWLAPGEHFVEVFAAGAVEPGFTRSITIASGTETILTVDVDGAREATVRDRPVPPAEP